MKNVEFVVLKSGSFDEAEKFNLEFSSVSYYYLLKLRKIKIASCSYIKIRINNELRETPVRFTNANGILFIRSSFDFSHYKQLPRKEKLKFQYEMMYEILKHAFIKYDMDWKILDDINNELATNNWEMWVEWVKKKVNKQNLFTLLIYLDIDFMTFVAEISEGGKKDELQIFKSITGFFVIEYLFKAYKIIDNKIRIGSKEKAIFEIDINDKTVKIIDPENEGISMFEFGNSSNLLNRQLPIW